MTSAVQDHSPTTQSPAVGKRQKAMHDKSPLEAITAQELQTLRLDDNSRAEFDIFAKRFVDSRVGLRAFAGEDVSTMTSDRYDEHSAAEAERRSSGLAVVHFMAPRIRRLREGEAKRKWRSFLKRFMKSEGLN